MSVEGKYETCGSMSRSPKMKLKLLTEILCETYGLPKDLAATVCRNFLRAFRKCPENVDMSLQDWRHSLWTQALGDQYKQFADEIYHRWHQLRYHYLALGPHIHTMLLDLHKSHYLGLITNGTSNAQWEKILELGLKPYFDIVLVSGDVAWEKPNAQIFHTACDHLAVPPQYCMMVGDKLETDILGGLRARFGATVWLPLADEKPLDGPYRHHQPNFIIDDILDVKKVLELYKNDNYGTMVKLPPPIFDNHHRIIRFLADSEDSNSNSSCGST